MKIKKRWSVLFLTIALLLAVSVTAYAHETPDLTRTGTISFTMRQGETVVPGGALTLYPVGEVCEDDGSYRFAVTEAFADSGVSLDDLSAPALAETLAACAADRGLTGTVVEIDGNGEAVVEGLPLGLYLVVQTVAADGYEAVAPFVVSIPANENGTYVYDVDASPKMSALTEAKPGTPATPTTPTAPTTPSGPRLPQTGQLNWPVPVMAGLGLCLFLLGFALRSGRREMSHEA